MSQRKKRVTTSVTLKTALKSGSFRTGTDGDVHANEPFSIEACGSLMMLAM
jgi:hypothetical protein